MSLSGCTTLLSVSTDQPLQEDYGERTIGHIIDDELIESKALVNISKTDPGFDSAHIVVVSHNGVVLLAGQVRSARLRDLAANTVKKIRNVRKVHNEIAVAGPTSFPVRASDNWLTSKIKVRMIGTKGIDANRINVTTENGVVYLLGLLTREEGERAVDVVKRSYGVQKIVRIFEYID